MNKKLKALAALLLAFTFAATAAGCGSGSKSNDTSSNGGSTAKKVVVHSWTKPNQDTTQAGIKQHDAWLAKVKEKFPNYELQEEAQKPGVDYRQEYDKALMAGNAPDCWWGLPYVDIQTRIKNGTIADITDLVNSWDVMKTGNVWKQFDEAIKDKNGHWFAVPHNAYVMATCIDKKNFQAAGGDLNNLPKSWDEFAQLAQKGTDKNKPVFGYEMMGMEYNAWPFTPWVWSAGGEMVRPNGDGTYKIAFNEPAGVDAAVFMNELIWKYNATQKDVLQDYNKLFDDIQGGRTVFSWANPMGLDSTKLEKVGLKLSDFTAMKFPVKDSSIQQPVFSGGEVITINPKASKEVQKAAFEIATYIAYDEDVLKEQWKIGNDNNALDPTPCVMTNLTQEKMDIQTNIPEDYKKFVVDAIATAKPEPFCSNWNDLKNALVIPLQTIYLKKGITRDEVQKILDNCANELYSKYPTSFKK